METKKNLAAGKVWVPIGYRIVVFEVERLLQVVDPSIVLIGPEIHQFTGTPNVDPKDSTGADWLRTFLKIAGDKVDVVSIHRYPFPNTAERRSATR